MAGNHYTYGIPYAYAYGYVLAPGWDDPGPEDKYPTANLTWQLPRYQPTWQAQSDSSAMASTAPSVTSLSSDGLTSQKPAGFLDGAQASSYGVVFNADGSSRASSEGSIDGSLGTGSFARSEETTETRQQQTQTPVLQSFTGDGSVTSQSVARSEEVTGTLQQQPPISTLRSHTAPPMVRPLSIDLSQILDERTVRTVYENVTGLAADLSGDRSLLGKVQPYITPIRTICSEAFKNDNFQGLNRRQVELLRSHLVNLKIILSTNASAQNTLSRLIEDVQKIVPPQAAPLPRRSASAPVGGNRIAQGRQVPAAVPRVVAVEQPRRAASAPVAAVHRDAMVKGQIPTAAPALIQQGRSVGTAIPTTVPAPVLLDAHIQPPAAVLATYPQARPGGVRVAPFTPGHDAATYTMPTRPPAVPHGQGGTAASRPRAQTVPAKAAVRTTTYNF